MARQWALPRHMAPGRADGQRVNHQNNSPVVGSIEIGFPAEAATIGPALKFSVGHRLTSCSASVGAARSQASCMSSSRTATMRLS